MTKLNSEFIVAIAGAYEKIGQAHLEIAEYLKALANGFPSINEVEPDTKEVTKEEAKKETKAPVEAEVEESAEVTANIIETEEGEVNLDEMTLKELKAFADEYGIEYPKKVKKDELIEIIMQAVEEAGEEDEEDVAEVDEDVAEEVEEAADEEDEAVEEATEEEEERSTIITVETEDGEEEADEEEVEEVEEDVEDDSEDGEEDDEDIAEMYGLNEMSLEELAEICAEHGLSTKGKRQALIDRIVRAIEDGTIEVEDEEEGE